MRCRTSTNMISTRDKTWMSNAERA